MKKSVFLLLFVFLLAASTAGAQDYNGALAAAKKENKPVLLYFFSNSCYYCKLMDKTTLVDRDIESVLKKDFVFFRVDTDKNGDLSMLYRITGTPSSWFLEASGKRIFQAPGYVEKGDYRILLDYIKGKHYRDTDLQVYFAKAKSKK